MKTVRHPTPGGPPLSIAVGIDLISPETILDSIAAHGDRYLERVYTDREVAECRTGTGLNARGLAARFAAKEATIKALRPTLDDALPWREIEVRRGTGGSASLLLRGRAATLAAERGVTGVVVSLSQQKGIASAIVIAQIRSDT